MCRKEWASLGNMEKDDAMVEFVKLLNKCCNLFAPYVTSHKIEREEQERKRWEDQLLCPRDIHLLVCLKFSFYLNLLSIYLEKLESCS